MHGGHAALPKGESATEIVLTEWHHNNKNESMRLKSVFQFQAVK